MKRFFAFTTVLLFSLQFTGLYFYYIVRIIEIQKEVREQLQTMAPDKLERFVFSKSQYQNLRVNDDEMKINEKMYDVSRIGLKNDSVTVYALHDAAEDNLIAFVDFFLKRLVDNKKQVPANLLTLFGLYYLPSAFVITYPGLTTAEEITHYPVQYDSIKPALPTPPPQLLLTIA